MVSDAELKVKIFRLVDAQAGESLQEIYRLLLEQLKSQQAEHEESAEETRNLYAQTDALAFWEDPREDLYQDYLESEQQ